MITKDKSTSIVLIVCAAISLVLRIFLISLAIKDNTPDSLIEKILSISVSFTFLVFFIADLLLKGKRSSSKHIVIASLCTLALAVSIIYAKLAVNLCGDKFIADAYFAIDLGIFLMAFVAVHCLKEFGTLRNRNAVIIASSALPFIVSVIMTATVFNTLPIADMLFLSLAILTNIAFTVDSIIWVVKRKKLSE